MTTRWYCRAVPVLLGAGCLLALAACGVPGAAVGSSGAGGGSSASASPAASSGPSAGQSAAAAACTQSQLTISLTHTGAVANQAGGYLTFTNQGSAACQLTGWPTVDGVTQAGTATPLAHASSTMFGAWHLTSPLPVVTLAPGDSAYAVVAGDEIPVGSATSCPAPYTRLEVTIPGGSSATTVSAWLPSDNTYLPTCATISGTPADEISDIVPLSSLPH